VSPQKPFSRPKYFSGRLLTAEDLQDEQNYFIEKRKLHNRYLHSFGIVCGLEISLKDERLIVKPGYALDCVGNDIIVCELVEMDLPDKDKREVFVGLKYHEIETEPAPHFKVTEDTEEDSTQFSRIQESFKIQYETENPLSKHHSDICGVCEEQHSIPLGRLKYRRGQWRRRWWFRRPQ